MSSGNPLVEAATEVQAVCQDRRWRFCFIGGLAVLRWGEPRLTRHVDLTIVTGYGDEAQYVDVLIDHLEPRIENARAFGIDNRVVLAEATNGVPIGARSPSRSARSSEHLSSRSRGANSSSVAPRT